MRMKKKIFNETLLIVFVVIFSAIGGFLISEKNWFLGAVSFLFSFIVSFMLSKKKQDKILYGTSETPGPASNFPEGQIYLRHEA